MKKNRNAANLHQGAFEWYAHDSKPTNSLILIFLGWKCNQQYNGFQMHLQIISYESQTSVCANCAVHAMCCPGTLSVCRAIGLLNDLNEVCDMLCVLRESFNSDYRYFPALLKRAVLGTSSILSKSKNFSRMC